MAFQPGQIITANRLNRLQPTPYRVVATSALTGPQTNADIPGAVLNIVTETTGARYTAVLVVDVDLNGSTTALASARLLVDGAFQSEFAVFGAEVSTDRGSVTQTYEGTLGTAGAHTLKVAATLAANQSINLYTSLLITVYEVA